MLNRRNRWVWAAGVLLLAGSALQAQEQKTTRIEIEDLKKRVDQNQDLFFLDVREPKEIEELGSLKGYVNIPVGQIESRLSEIPKDRFIVTA
jgi:rhodanese-related sulfurtransferase